MDEVHRLSPEGHETMLDTFLRRIPVDVVLPDFQERTLEEKYELILFMIHQEAKTMRATFQVSSNVINRLLTFQGKGNIGTLKNIIRLSCAKAYNERTRGQEVISFNLSHLSSDSLLLGNGESIPYINETIKVSPDQDAEWKISMTEQQDVDFSEEVMNNLVREYLEKDISTIKFRKIIYDEVNRIADTVIDQEIHPYMQNLYTQAVRNILIYLQDNYGLKYSGVMEMVFVKMLYIHMCVMVERLILEKGRLTEEDMTHDQKCRESFVKNLKESFSVIENKYNVSLNDREILMIYYLTENN